MRNVNWTRLLTILLTLLALYAVLAVAGSIIQRFILPLLLLVFGAIVAFVLTPIVNMIQNRLRIFRGGAIALTYLMIIIILSTLGFFISQPLIKQTRSLANGVRTPSHLANIVLMRNDLRLLTSGLNSVRRPTLQRCAAVALIGSSRQTTESTGEIQTFYLGYLSRHKIPQEPPSYCETATPREPTVLHLIANLDKYAGQLSNPPKNEPIAVIGQPGHTATTPIPSRWTAGVPNDFSNFYHLTQTRVYLLGSGSSPPHRSALIGFATRLLKATKKLHTDVHTLYTTVTTTPIIVFALQRWIDQHNLPINLHDLLGKALSQASTQGSTILDNAVAILTGTINVIFDLIVIIIISVYLLADGGRFIGWLMSLVPENRREQVWFFVKSLDKVLGGFIRGQIVVAIMIGILAGVGSWAIGVPYALLLGIFAMLAESIPVFGPVIASIPAILVALFSLSLLKTFLVLAWFVVIQQVEQNLVGPRITGRAVGIHPVVAMVSVLVGVEVGGIIGAFLAVPIAGILSVICREFYRVIILQRPMQTATVPDLVEPPDFEDAD